MNQKVYRRNFILSLFTLFTLFGLKAQATPTPTILVLGDSLSAEYGLVRGTGWVALLEKRLATEKISALVVNASISGETTSGGRSRLAALLLRHRPTVVVIELGANDALRGLSLQNTQENLDWMTQTAQKAKTKVLLLGMQVPPNYGSDYTAQFAHIFQAVAQKYKVALLPFLLKGIADNNSNNSNNGSGGNNGSANTTALFQADQIHPRALAHPQILENVWSALRPLLR